MTKVLEKQFATDVENIQALDIVPSMLELICRTTGMGFSAVARVTEQRWIACAVRDEINFGLKPGGELEIGTTICNEIRQHRQPVVIDEVSRDGDYCQHHTPKLYGIESYISIPIILKDGHFFGTLCAIDLRPAVLKAGKLVTMLTLFADLIAYHLQSQDQAKAKEAMLQMVQMQLNDSQEDVRQLNHINNHTLQEPLRKLQVYSDMLIMEQTTPADHPLKHVAGRINVLARRFTSLINELTIYSSIGEVAMDGQLVDLNKVLNSAQVRLSDKIAMKNASIYSDILHTIPGVQAQLNQLFYYLLDNALNFSRPGKPLEVKVYSRDVERSELGNLSVAAPESNYCRVYIEDNGLGMDQAFVSQIFDLFVKLNTKDEFPGLGTGLSQSKKIMRNHNGAILVESEEGKGSVFSLVFPVDRDKV